MFEQEDTGIIQLNSFWFKIEHTGEEKYFYRVIVCCTESKEMTLLYAQTMNHNLVEIDDSLIIRNHVLDLNRQGRRWEGSVLNNQPFGYGFEYSEEDNLLYSGFMYKGERICYGAEYNDDTNNNREVYCGQYLHNVRNGKGTTYDLNGDVDFNGEWEDNKPVDRTKQAILAKKDKVSIFVSSNSPDFALSFQEIRVSTSAPGNEYQIYNFHICPFFSRLQSLEITDFNVEKTIDFVIDGMLCLTSIKIGDDCFSVRDSSHECDSIVSIRNCYSLQSLYIGQNTFSSYSLCELFNLRFLLELRFGERSFSSAAELKIECMK